MFFKLYDNMNIGLKCLSDADLGISKDSNQTHIGLYQDTLSFIKEYTQYSFAQFIYQDSSKELLSFLDSIKNKDGTHRSPKIRTGSDSEINYNGKSVNSIVREIRKIATDKSKKWYLIWFGLENHDLVFFLIKENSDDYNKLINIIGELPNKAIFKNDELRKIIRYLDIKVNDANSHYLEELEVAVQLDNKTTISRVIPKERDLHKAQKLLIEIGKQGENLLNEYLERNKKEDKIKNYEWMNKSRESGLPYDFIIIENDGRKYYSDAKSTSYDFKNNIFFSSNELKFINENKNYYIHRIYNMSKKPALRISKNISKVTDSFMTHYMDCKNNLIQNGLKLNSAKIEVPPALDGLDFLEIKNFTN